MSKRSLRAVLATVGLVAWGPGIAQAASPCRTSVTVTRGDTLSRIAGRCDVTERGILNANPAVQGSDDLQAGMDLKLPASSADSTFDAFTAQLRGYATQASDAVESVANQVGSSVQELLDANPDLHQRLGKLGDHLNIPGANAARQELSIAPQSGAPGSSVTVSAIGLPKNSQILIGAGAPRAASQALDRARTTDAGTLQVTIPVPAWASEMDKVQFVVADSAGRTEARSTAFNIVK